MKRHRAWTILLTTIGFVLVLGILPARAVHYTTLKSCGTDCNYRLIINKPYNNPYGSRYIASSSTTQATNAAGGSKSVYQVGASMMIEVFVGAWRDGWSPCCPAASRDSRDSATVSANKDCQISMGLPGGVTYSFRTRADGWVKRSSTVKYTYGKSWGETAAIKCPH